MSNRSLLSNRLNRLKSLKEKYKDNGEEETNLAKDNNPKTKSEEQPPQRKVRGSLRDRMKRIKIGTETSTKESPPKKNLNSKPEEKVEPKSNSNARKYRGSLSNRMKRIAASAATEESNVKVSSTPQQSALPETKVISSDNNNNDMKNQKSKWRGSLKERFSNLTLQKEIETSSSSSSSSSSPRNPYRLRSPQSPQLPPRPPKKIFSSSSTAQEPKKDQIVEKAKNAMIQIEKDRKKGSTTERKGTADDNYKAFFDEVGLKGLMDTSVMSMKKLSNSAKLTNKQLILVN